MIRSVCRKRSTAAPEFRQPRRARAGFSVIECLIATFILVLGFLALASVYPTSYRGAIASRNRARAMLLARGALEQARATPWRSAVVVPLQTFTDVVEGVQATDGSGVAQSGTNPSITYTVTVAFRDDSHSNNSASCAIAIVTVAWREGTLDGGGGVDKRVTLWGAVPHDYL